MSWTDKLRDALGSDDADERRVNRGLIGLHSGFRARSDAMRAHAEIAPTPGGAARLNELAASHDQSATLLAQALRERAVTLRGPLAEADPAVAVNHWARLVADLESVRQGRDQLLEMSTRMDDEPAIFALLLRLLNRIEEDLVEVRREVARADPQALN